MTTSLQSPGRDPIRVDLSYPTPLFDRVKLGGTPRDYFDRNPRAAADEVPCEGGVCANLPQEIWVRNPRLEADGKPQLRTLSEHLEGRAASPVLNALGWGTLAAGAGALLGGLVGGLALGAPGIGAALVGTLSGALTGTAAARHATGDRIALEWVQHPIVHTEMKGYRENVTPGRLHGVQGYFHRFQPVLRTNTMGAWKTPQIVHHREEPRA